MKHFILMGALIGVSFGLSAQDELPRDLWTWMIAGKQRLVVHCQSRGKVDIDSFDSELQIIKRTTSENGCEVFDVMHVQDDAREAWMSNIHINATVYGLDRLKRSPSKLMKMGFFDRVTYPIKLLGVRVQTKRLGNKLTRFLEHKEHPRTEQVSKEYFNRFVEQSQLIHDDFLTLSR
tara:strand:- start:475 stop:1005 length:531 start_codon:yes stop_codon:yes gene_type:complete